MSLMSEFKQFAMRGNVMDLAIAVVIGGAFGKIVTSLVKDVIMPPVGLLISGIDFQHWKWVLHAAGPDGKGEVAIMIGSFLNTVVQFIIIAFAIFMVVKLMNGMKRKQEEAPTEPAAPPADVQLLTEIRDLLKSGKD